MFNSSIFISSNEKLDFFLKVSLGALFICLISPIEIENEESVSITLQSLIILLVPMLFGFRVGLFSYLLYLGIGAVGLPVFPGYHGGWTHLVSEVGGFYFGFLVAVIVVGMVSDKLQPTNLMKILALWLGGHILILLLGFNWYWRIHPPTVVWYREIAPLLPGVLIKTAMGLLVIQLIHRMSSKKSDYFR